jgi:hypothetical protein
MGCAAEVEKSIETARGSVEVDVFATDVVSGHDITYVCECKLWTKPISQHVVHSFRTVVADMGADVGIIISANGFQRGAVAAAELTNIRLLTWEEYHFSSACEAAMRCSAASVASYRGASPAGASDLIRSTHFLICGRLPPCVG